MSRRFQGLPIDELVTAVVRDYEYSRDDRSSRETEWTNIWKAINCKPRRDRVKGRANAVSPHAAQTIRQLVPLIKRQILVTKPLTRAVPRKRELQHQSDLLALLMDHWIDIADIRHLVLTLGLKEALAFGTAFIKVFHDLQTRTIQSYDAAGKLVNQEEVVFEGPRVIVPPVEDVYPDPTARMFSECEYVIHRFFSTVGAMEDSGMYDAEAIDKLRTGANTKSGSADARYRIPIDTIFAEQRRRVLGMNADQFRKALNSTAGTDDEPVEILEMTCFGTVYSVANRSILAREHTLDHPMPWAELTPDPLPGELYGKPVLSDSLSSLDQRDFLVNLMYDGLAANVRPRYMGIPHLIDQASLQGGPGSMVKVRSMDALKSLETTDVSQGSFAMLRMLDSEIERGTGLTQPLSSVGPSGPVYNETATVGTLKNENALLFIQEMVSNIERSLSSMARIIYDVEREYVTREYVIKVAGEDGARWIDDKSDTLARDVDFYFVGSQYAASKQTQMNALMAVFDRSLAVEARKPGTVDLSELTRTLYDVAGIPNRERIVSGQPRDMGPEAEHEAMRQGVPAVAEPDEDHQVHLAAHMQEFQRATQEGDDEDYMTLLAQHLTQHQKLLAMEQKQIQQAAMAAAQQQPPQGGANVPAVG